jgi:hypothetical protein
LKNFPTENILRHQVKNVANDVKIIDLTYFWILSYTTPT